MQMRHIVQSIKRKRAAFAAATVALLLVGTGALFVTRDPNRTTNAETEVAGKELVPGDGVAGDGVPGDSSLETFSTTAEAPDPSSAVAPAQREADPDRSPEPTSTPFRSPIRCDATSTPQTGTAPGEDERNGKRWVTVQKLDGACDKSSSEFVLRGIDTRLVWRSDAGQFNAFLIDVANRDAAAGYADADCSGPCSEYQSLTSKAADYTLRVQADGGPWEVLVQEYR